MAESDRTVEERLKALEQKVDSFSALLGNGPNHGFLSKVGFIHFDDIRSRFEHREHDMDQPVSALFSPDTKTIFVLELHLRSGNPVILRAEEAERCVEAMKAHGIEIPVWSE